MSAKPNPLIEAAGREMAERFFQNGRVALAPPTRSFTREDLATHLAAAYERGLRVGKDLAHKQHQLER